MRTWYLDVCLVIGKYVDRLIITTKFLHSGKFGKVDLGDVWFQRDGHRESFKIDETLKPFKRFIYLPVMWSTVACSLVWFGSIWLFLWYYLKSKVYMIDHKLYFLLESGISEHWTMEAIITDFTFNTVKNNIQRM